MTTTSKAATAGRGIGRALLVLLGVGLLGLGASLGWLKMHESQLVFRTAESRLHTDGSVPGDAERLDIAVQGEHCAALLLPADPGHDSGYWVLHLHGNADSAFSPTHLRHLQALRSLGLSAMGLDYRGFGFSTGTASETHIDEDAEAAYQTLLRRGVPPERIIVWGHSLGSGPAVYLATLHPVAALVLFGAYTSLPDAAQDTYPYLPVRWIVGPQFDSIDRIGRIHSPVLIVHSLGDRIVPFHHGLQLFAAAREPKRLLQLPPPYSDEFGGHINALYDHLDLAVTQLQALGLQVLGLRATSAHLPGF
jgi:pimeloyl-ACP methyl ester carboxylesterase